MCFCKAVKELHSLRAYMYQNFGVEFEQALKLNCFFMYFLSRMD